MSWLRNPKVFSAIIFLVLIGLIWFAGPYLGLTSVESRYGWIFLLMLVWVVILMVGKVIHERSANLLEKMLRHKADDAVVSASPENRAEVAMLRRQLLAAIETLKASNLGKTKGKAALYDLPWYMIVGHPSAGKSCAILNSGLKFPLAGKSGGAVTGIGGTRNCDWFFSSEGVLLDTAGRYATQTEDRMEWLEFLKMLKKYRGKAPLNGILVAISFPELIQHQSESFAAYTRQVRQRINEVDDIFGMKIPVYLVFTKIDLLRGFSQFFEDLPEEERQQVWGATLAHEQPDSFEAVKVVAQHFEGLYQGLVKLGSDKLADHRSNLSRPALFAFPLEFHGLKDAVSKFVEHLVEPDPYHTRPLIRGFYFTSALQENGRGTSSVNRISSTFDLTKSDFLPSELSGSRPYFLESLFRKVIFPDLFLVGRQARPGRNRARLMGIAAGLAVLALLTGCWTWSFIGNHDLINVAQDEKSVARGLYRSQELGDKLKALQILQYRIEQLYQYRQEGHPWKLGWGLYNGNAVEAALRVEYFNGVRELMLEPVKKQLEDKLAGKPDPVVAPVTTAAKARGRAKGVPPASPGRPAVASGHGLEDVYNALKTYLMLHDRSRMETAQLTDQIARYWRPWLEANAGGHPVSEISRMAERTLAFYVSQLKEPDLPTIDNREDLVTAARLRLRGEEAQLSPMERIYSEMKAQGNTRFAPITVARILNNKNLDLIGGSAVVSGSFCREAWDQFFRDGLDQAALGQFKGTDWVLASPLEQNMKSLGTVDENRAKLTELYKADYAREWQNFLLGVAVHPFSDFDRASAALGKFADPQNSPIKLILAKAGYETSWDNPSEVSKSLNSVKSKVIQRTETMLGNSAPGSAGPGAQLGEVGGKFAALASLLAAQDGGRATIDGYLDMLQKVKGKLAGLNAGGDPGGGARSLMQATLAGTGSEFADAYQFVDNDLLGRVDENAKETLRPILVRPLMEAYGPLGPAVEEDLNRAWAQQVYGLWSHLATMYPFSDSSNDAPMADIVRFLKPGDGILAHFIDKNLGTMVVRHGDTYSARSWAGKGAGLGPNFLNGISRLTQAGNTLLQDSDVSRFEIQPIPTPGLSETALEIDGQRLVYRNGPQTWTPFSWPGQSGAQVARIQATSNIGATTQVQSCSGRLGLMRLLDNAQIENPGGSASALEWKFKVAKAFSSRDPGADGGGTDYFPHGVRFNFRMINGANPLQLNVLRHQTLPARVEN